MEEIDGRRSFIKKLTAAGLFASTVGLPTIINAAAPIKKSLPSILPPVNVSSERIIRTVVGLRPYRPSGFNLGIQKLDDALVIHNYGHGGGGISLSWGSASLAIEKIKADKNAPIAVMGAGVIGLSTAILLLKQGRSVTIYTDRLPPNTTSNVAAAFWAPVSVYESNQVTSDFMTNFNIASTRSQRMFQDLVGSRYGVWWMTSYFLGAPFDFPGGKELYPDFKRYNAEESPFGRFSLTDEMQSLMIEPPIYLKTLLDDFFQLGGKLVIRKFSDLSEVAQLQERTIMNCTGLGSNQLFGDDSLVPAKGQLEVLLPQNEIRYGYVVPSNDDLLYMFPRKDGIVLGGTSEKGNWSLEPSDAERKRIINGHIRIANNLRK